MSSFERIVTTGGVGLEVFRNAVICCESPKKRKAASERAALRLRSRSLACAIDFVTVSVSLTPETRKGQNASCCQRLICFGVLDLQVQGDALHLAQHKLGFQFGDLEPESVRRLPKSSARKHWQT